MKLSAIHPLASPPAFNVLGVVTICLSFHNSKKKIRNAWERCTRLKNYPKAGSHYVNVPCTTVPLFLSPHVPPGVIGDLPFAFPCCQHLWMFAQRQVWQCLQTTSQLAARLLFARTLPFSDIPRSCPDIAGACLAVCLPW